MIEMDFTAVQMSTKICVRVHNTNKQTRGKQRQLNLV